MASSRTLQSRMTSRMNLTGGQACVRACVLILCVTGVSSMAVDTEETMEEDNTVQPPCHMLNNLQDAILQVMTAHYEYGRGIHHLHNMVNQIQTDLTQLHNDISDLKGQLYELELGQGKGEGKGQEEWDSQKHVKQQEVPPAIKEVDQQLHPSPTSPSSSPAALADPYSSLIMDNITQFMAPFFANPLSSKYPDLAALLVNMTGTFQAQSDKMDGIQRRVHGLRRQVKQTTNGMATWEKTFKLYDARTLSHMLDKQREINTALGRRVRLLEDTMKIQRRPFHDQPHPNAINTVSSCPPDFVRHGPSCYYFSNVSEHWVDAEKHCQHRHPNSHLVAIETQSELDYIIMYRKYNAAHWSSYYVWTGGTNMLVGGGWRWVGTERPLTFNKWRAGQPKNKGHEQQCLYLQTVGTDSMWDEWHCYAARLNYICEIML